MKTVSSVGVDLGGTWMRVHAVDAARKPVKSLKVASKPASELPASLKELWKKWKLGRPEHLVVASKGVWSPADRKGLEKELSSLAKRVTALSDVELEFESAFTPKNAEPGKAHGVLILAGTGSIAFGRDPSGRVARAGGLGPSMGDEGSGFWIGKEYMRLVAAGRERSGWVRDLVRAQDSVMRIAALSRTVFAKARTDKPCANIVRMAQTHLSELVMGVVQKLRFEGTVPVSWSGGLFANAWFRKGFWETLNDVNPKIKFVVTAPRQDPAQAAAEWGDRLEVSPMSRFGYEVPLGR